MAQMDFSNSRRIAEDKPESIYSEIAVLIEQSSTLKTDIQAQASDRQQSLFLKEWQEIDDSVRSLSIDPQSGKFQIHIRGTAVNSAEFISIVLPVESADKDNVQKLRSIISDLQQCVENDTLEILSNVVFEPSRIRRRVGLKWTPFFGPRGGLA
jgi:vacuolar-type H+-ATPase subunit D/Vma8